MDRENRTGEGRPDSSGYAMPSLTQQQRDDHKAGPSFGALIVFVLCLAATLTLLIAALVMWLAQLLDSVALACIITGGAAALISLGIYLFALRRTFRLLHEYIDTVYETSRIAKSGYDYVKAWIVYLFG